MSASRVGRRSAFGVLGALGVIVAVNVPSLGSDPWPFRPPPVVAHGLLAPLVNAADGHWDLGVVRTPAMLAGVIVAALAIAGWRTESWRGGVLIGACITVVLLVTVPATLLQVGLRDGSAPWFHTNDSTYQIELAGELVRHGHTPYGHDFSGSGLDRFYSRDGSLPPPTDHPQVALTHFAYFPGTALTAAAWSFVPSPFDDYRVLVLLATIGCFFAVLLFDAPLPSRLVVGAAVAASPLMARGAWFGTADATALLALLLAFGLLTRSRYVWAGVALAAAILLKQFALVAVPFFVVMLLARGLPRAVLLRTTAAFGVVLAAGFLPFLIADPGALWRDTISYGTGTYRILGYGLSALLLNLGVIDDRYSAYPFALLALVVWLPVTAWLVWTARRSARDWEAAAGFAASIFVLLFIARVFQTSYLVWPLTGIAVAFLLAQREVRGSSP
jgi:Glycosyltransferase family 87